MSDRTNVSRNILTRQLNTSYGGTHSIPGIRWQRVRAPAATTIARRAASIGFVVAAGLSATPRLTVAQDAATGANRATLPELIEQALATHPSIRAQRAAVDEAQSSVRVVGAYRSPRIEALASATRYQDPMLVQPLHGLPAGSPIAFDETLVQGGISLAYTVFDGGTSPGRLRQARARVDAARASLDESQALLIRLTTGAYVDVLARREVVDAHRSRVRALEAERERVGRVEAVGRAATVDVRRVEAALSSARAEGVRAEAAFDIAVRDLARLTGSAADAFAPPDRLARVRLIDSGLGDRESQLAAARAASPTMARARAQLDQSLASVKVAQGARWPAARLVATQLARGSDNHAMKAEWSIGGMLSVPLFTGGANANEVERARAAWRAGGEQLRLAELQVAQDLDRARAVVVEADARAASLRDAAEQFAEVTRIERLSLDAGAGTQTDYLQAEADLLAARAGLAEALAARISARAELARVCGELSPTWVERILEVVR